ncbi:sugar phosphate nucleotidyltransferase [Streptomyces sp. NPDC097941]|uniref:sugar phosphate nucleotidyltransferase n=1 Tax=Streptomyces sp. NPDC097941 TaxID=3155685 RepID=UPI003324246C
MKALVLSGGAGPRSRPITPTPPEPPVPVAHKAVLLSDGPQSVAASETHRVRVIVGEHLFTPVVHDAVRPVEPYGRAELEILHAVRQRKVQTVS